MRSLPALAAVLAAATLMGCRSTPTATRINEIYDPRVHRRIAVLPFESKYADGRSMADAFLTHLMASGFGVVDRGALDAAELSGDAPPTLAQLKKLKEAGVDAIVLGSIDAKKPGTEIDAVSVRMVDARDGGIILSSTYRNEKQLEANAIPAVVVEDVKAQLNKLAKRRLKEEKRRQRLAAKAAQAQRR